MGGSALNSRGVETRRIEGITEYSNIVLEVMGSVCESLLKTTQQDRIHACLTTTHLPPKQLTAVKRVSQSVEANGKSLSSNQVIFAPIPQYIQKESFGDVDFLILSQFDSKFWVELIDETFSPKAVVCNGGCISFDYKDFQVDFILVKFNCDVDKDSTEDITKEILSKAAEFDFGLRYYAWNDLGNFIGRTAHRCGFKFGHDGLWYVVRHPEDEDQVLGEVLVTDDFSKALTTLGWSSRDVAQHDFLQSKNEIFEFACRSKFFDPRQFLLQNRSYAARVRDAKRKMYSGMLEYLTQKYPDCVGQSPLPFDREGFVKETLEHFPEAKHKVECLLKEAEFRAFIKPFCNGKFVVRIGEEGNLHVPVGKDLGDVMTKLKGFIHHNSELFGNQYHDPDTLMLIAGSYVKLVLEETFGT